MEELKKRMMNPSQICKMQSQLPMAGYLYCQEKCELATVIIRPKFKKLQELDFFISFSLIFNPANRGPGGVMGEILLQVSQGWQGARHGALWAEACDQTGTELNDGCNCHGVVFSSGHTSSRAVPVWYWYRISVRYLP